MNTAQIAFLNKIHSRQLANPQEIRPAAEKFNEFLGGDPAVSISVTILSREVLIGKQTVRICVVDDEQVIVQTLAVAVVRLISR
jgi:hypothetical protein